MDSLFLTIVPFREVPKNIIGDCTSVYGSGSSNVFDLAVKVNLKDVEYFEHEVKALCDI